MKDWIVFILGFTLAIPAVGQLDDGLFDDIDALLKSYVSDGLVDYKALQESGSLSEIMSQIAGADIDITQKSEENLAFLINSYNMAVIAGVLDEYPIKSPMSISGFFDRRTYTVAGKELTLNQIENEYIRPIFEDPRIHFVLVCGALGCPPLISDVYRPATLDTQLDKQTRNAINNPDFIQYEKGKLKVSQIFQWYISDFGGKKSSVLEYIAKYHEKDIDRKTSVKFYTYDWTLNDQ